MIIKERDNNIKILSELECILTLPNLTTGQLSKIKKEIYNIKTGIIGEKESAYYLNFHFGESKNWAVIHDLRLKIGHRVAQIDHLLISRFLEFYVLESKNFTDSIEINELGECYTKNNKGKIGISSPIEQNKRHVSVLKKMLKEENILPSRLGVKMSPAIFSYVLMSNSSVIERPKKFNTESIIKAELFKKKLDDELKDWKPKLSDFTAVAKIVSSETLEKLAYDLVSFHQPIKIDWHKKFGIISKQENSNTTEKQASTDINSNYFCAKCKKDISLKVAKYCWDNKSKFGGRAYCYTCQTMFNKN